VSKGINVYDKVRDQFGSILEAKASELDKTAATDEPCIFLSHISEDKVAVKTVGEYIKNKGINIYLDAEDAELQQAVHDSDDTKITAFIEGGISRSSDVIVFISEMTKGSWWVPFELGYGKKACKVLACLKLKEVEHLPSFLSIVRRLRNTEDLDNYLLEVRQRVPLAKTKRGVRGELIYEIDAARHLIDLLIESGSGSKIHPLAKFVDEA
jgi:hypothetical protein